MPGGNFRYLTALLVYSLVFAADRISKSLVLKYLGEGYSTEIIRGLLNITVTGNTGIAFGLYKGFSVFLSIIGFLGFFLLFALYPEIRSARLFPWFIGLILGGATSNFLDRVLRGYVVDFIDIPFFSVFNLADVAITIGVMLMIYELLKKSGGAFEAGTD